MFRSPEPGRQGPPEPALLAATEALRRATAPLRFGPPVACVYRPLEYAWPAHRRFIERFGAAPKRALLVGLNPGPFGMVQTGVPFGDPRWVREFLGIDAPVRPPPVTHPRRPVRGFASPRREISGERFWGWVQGRFGSAERFFADFYIVNYCPLAFVDTAGRNLTPDKLAAADRTALYAVCDRGLEATVAALEPRILLAIGRFAEQRLCALFGDRLVATLPHPSPASPPARRWQQSVEAILAPLGLLPTD